MIVYVAKVESARQDDTGNTIGVGLSFHAAVAICERHAGRPMSWSRNGNHKGHGYACIGPVMYSVTPYEAEP